MINAWWLLLIVPAALAGLVLGALIMAALALLHDTEGGG